MEDLEKLVCDILLEINSGDAKRIKYNKDGIVRSLEAETPKGKISLSITECED